MKFKLQRFQDLVKKKFKKPTKHKRISKPQKKLYKAIKKKYKDAELEYYLRDVKLHVDIFVPSTQTVYELYGDFWHCHRDLFLDENATHPYIKSTIKEIRKKDSYRELQIRLNGYKLVVVWESELDNFIKKNF